MSRTVVSSKKPAWIVFAVALILHTGLISVQAGRRIDTSFVRMWILDSLTPMEKLVDRSLNGVSHVWNRYFALIGLHDENQQLRAKVDELQMELQKQSEEVQEARRLRAIFDLSETGIGKTVVARVVGSSPGHNETVTIDKGRSHGVKEDSAVMTPSGIVGRVIHSSNFSSIVQLIFDSQSAVGVMLQSTRRQGVLRGNGGRELELEYIDDDNDIKEGDIFITSGQDRIYPKGLPVGVITSVGPRRGLFKTVQVRPSADMGRLEEVICVIERPQYIDPIDLQGPTLP